MLRRSIALCSSLIAGLLLAVTVHAQSLQEGTHYRVIAQPLNVAIPAGKDGIIQEFFWYGCVHCFNLETAVQRFKAQLPDNIAFEEVPATFSPVHELQGRAFYTWQFLNMPEDTHMAIYNEIFVNRNNLRTERDLAAFFARQGVSEERFQQMFNSFSVRTKTRVAQNMTAQAQVRGTPSVVVNGRYLIESGLPGVRTNEDMLRIAQELALQLAAQ